MAAAARQSRTYWRPPPSQFRTSQADQSGRKEICDNRQWIVRYLNKKEKTLMMMVAKVEGVARVGKATWVERQSWVAREEKVARVDLGTSGGGEEIKEPRQ